MLTKEVQSSNSKSNIGELLITMTDVKYVQFNETLPVLLSCTPSYNGSQIRPHIKCDFSGTEEQFCPDALPGPDATSDSYESQQNLNTGSLG